MRLREEAYRNYFVPVVRDCRAVTVVEFALVLPLLIFAILGLLELANTALQRQRISQAALLIADNAGRLGNMGMMGPEKITEAQINDALISAEVQQPQLGLAARGRIILTSLEYNKDGGQWLHWQRCRGALIHASSWGSEKDGEHGKSVDGMGPKGARITADPDQPVMFVEIAYKMEPLVFPALVSDEPIVETAAMPIRVDRDTSEVVEGKTTRSGCK